MWILISFNGRINGIVDVYTSKTTDLLMAQSIPTLTGYARTYANVGKTKNFWLRSDV